MKLVDNEITLKELIASRIFDYEGYMGSDDGPPSELSCHEIAQEVIDLLKHEDLLKDLPTG